VITSNTCELAIAKRGNIRNRRAVLKKQLSKARSITCAEGMTLLVLPGRCRPLVNHVITDGGLLIADTQLSVIVSPALALRCPLIVTFSGATAEEHQPHPMMGVDT